MNTLFWIIVAGLVLLALALIVPPLLRKTPLPDDDHRQRNIKIARQRLAELRQQLQDGVLDQVQFDEQYAELQLMLNDDLQASEAGKAPERQGRWIIPILLVLLPMLSLLLYVSLGDINALSKVELQQTQVKAAENMAGMMGKLQQRLQQQPDDVEGWIMLGRSYGFLQQYQDAADAFARADKLKPDDVEIMLQYANNLAMARGGSMKGEPEQLIARVIEKAPDNANALWLAGMAMAEAGDFAKAKQYWQKLLQLLPPDAEGLSQVQQMLAAVDQELEKQRSAGPAIEIKVKVTIDPALKANLQPQDAVFIYAQAVNGPKMPLAIVRKQASDLPTEVVLNDQMAMQGSSRLGEQQQLRIVARVSKSGQAMTQPGDLLGSVELAQPFAGATANVLINQEVK
ncbi:c-type cytochrome biogenesis protein CcmI [Methylomonas rapida]|uniref:C-type cytochrome biogenesis protein CcmI n=1 Tax=Methylomonas rapida TaxID=2963939 RepID=A0ABY7GF52_9GAMM|nr:c-type cytochrome biogenesis protein CcmI [Methylomonas rapida]WAR43066.1 c-type cytochrome biogenesis protein CcmI [Methylomonas rapida]